MPGSQALLLTPPAVRRLLKHVLTHSRYPARDRVIVALSFRAGLRAAEIAGMRWRMVLDPYGKVADRLTVEDAIAKRRGGRIVPMHRELRAALIALRAELDASPERDAPIVTSERGGPMRAGSIVNLFAGWYAALGFEGCSSHSGRRTFVTTAARNLAKAGGSLRDVQLLAGHRQLATTERYIQGDTHAQRRLIALL
jgi:integrase